MYSIEKGKDHQPFNTPTFFDESPGLSAFCSPQKVDGERLTIISRWNLLLVNSDTLSHNGV